MNRQGGGSRHFNNHHHNHRGRGRRGGRGGRGRGRGGRGHRNSNNYYGGQAFANHPNDNYNDEYIEVHDNINQCSFNYLNNNQKMTTDF